MVNSRWEFDTSSNREAESDGANVGQISAQITNDGEVDWLATVRHAADTSEKYMSANLRARWSRSYSAFQSKHFEGSKYVSKRYRGRSSLFRPKTRMAVRKADANVAAAFFATQDVVQMTAENDGDPLQLAGAKLQHELMNLRLDRASTNYGIPWFLTVIGAHQDAKITGICATKQSWLYEEQGTGEFTDYVDPETGEEYSEEVMKKTVSRPNVELFPPEMVLRDPAAHWIDQAQNSSYVILKYPMTVGDIKARMRGTGDPTKAEWSQADDKDIRRSVITQDNSGVRRSREGKGLDRLENNYTSVRDFEIAWVHENFVRWEGKDWHFWTLGTYHMLTEPQLVRDAYPEQNGRRPVVIGYGQVEAHKIDPQSSIESIQPLQQEANDIVNLRLDNVKQNMSPVTKIRRGRNVDVSQVQNRSPDSVIWMNDLTDVEWDRPPDVSGSSYNEMDRINVDMDDLGGTFSTSSVQSNRQLNETVGGMNLLNANANSVAEFDIRVLNETWMEPTLRQLANLNAYYESDEAILTIAGAKAGLWDKYVEGLYDIDGLLMQNVQLRVDAGTGVSDPMQRIQKLRMGAETLSAFLGPERASGMVNAEAVIEEVFGMLGYKDGKRFFDMDGPAPELQEAMQELEAATEEIENLQFQLEEGEADRENKVLLEKIKAAVKLVSETMETDRQKYQGLIQQTSQVLGHHSNMKAHDQRAQQTAMNADLSREKMKAAGAARSQPSLV